MDGSTKRLRAKRSSRAKRRVATDEATEACVGHLYTIIGRMEFISTNAALVLLGVITLVATRDRETLTEFDMGDMFLAGYGSKEASDGTKTLTTALDSLMGAN